MEALQGEVEGASLVATAGSARGHGYDVAPAQGDYQGPNGATPVLPIRRQGMVHDIAEIDQLYT